MTCCNCHGPFAGHHGVGTDKPPSPGDVTICFSCGQWQRFGTDGTTTAISEAQVDTLIGADLRAKVERTIDNVRIKVAGGKARA